MSVRLSGREIARMRRTADDHLPVYGEVWRRSGASDGKGGQTQTLARASSGPWRAAPVTTITSTEQVFAARLGGEQGWWLSSQYHTEVELDDQIRTGGKVFEVVGFDTGRSWHITARVLCREVT